MFTARFLRRNSRLLRSLKRSSRAQSSVRGVHQISRYSRGLFVVLMLFALVNSLFHFIEFALMSRCCRKTSQKFAGFLRERGNIFLKTSTLSESETTCPHFLSFGTLESIQGSSVLMYHSATFYGNGCVKKPCQNATSYLLVSCFGLERSRSSRMTRGR